MSEKTINTYFHFIKGLYIVMFLHSNKSRKKYLENTNNLKSNFYRQQRRFKVGADCLEAIATLFQ